MRNLIVLLVVGVISGVRSEIDDRIKQDFFNIYQQKEIKTEEIIHKEVTPDEVKYFLFTKEHPDDIIEIDPSKPSPLVQKNAKIVFIIHGWLEYRKVEWYKGLKNAFLSRKEEFYVVEVDWSGPAKEMYSMSAFNTKDVGNIIGELIADLHVNHSVPLSNFFLVGHSLGGQVSGFIGKKVQELTNQKLPRIVALDPAGPLFSTRPEKERLNRNDAEVVQVMHTDGGTFGMKEPCGTIDIFFNGGSYQPGCASLDVLDSINDTELIACSHRRSPKYYIEAVQNPTEFLATPCSSLAKFEFGRCRLGQKVAMGDLESKIEGNFYLKTNKEAPYARESSQGVFDKVIPLLP